MKRGEPSAAGDGEPPALLTATSSRPWTVDDRARRARRPLGVADVAGDERRCAVQVAGLGAARTTTTVAPASAKRSADRPADAAGAAGDERDLAGEVQRSSVIEPLPRSIANGCGHDGAMRSARRRRPSAGGGHLPPLTDRQIPSGAVGTTSSVHDDGIAEVVMDNPPVNALTVAGWFELADTLTDARARPGGAGRRAAGRGPRASTPASTSRRCRRTEGFDALIGANRGCYAAFAAVYECPVPVDRGRQRLLPRRRHRPGRQRRRHRRRRRRHLRAARGRPRRARRRHPPGPARARSTRCGRWCTRRPPRPPQELHHFGSRARGRAPRRAARRRPRGGRPDRREVARPSSGPPRSSLNGIDPWDVKRSLPLRAGLHLRAQPLRRGRRAPRRVRRQARHGHAAT